MPTDPAIARAHLGAADPLAARAVADIRRGMTVGLGTGRAAARGIRALAERNSREQLKLVCVATSIASEQLAQSLGLQTRPPGEVSTLDVLFDGADEVDANLCMLKGGGAAMTRERIVASMVAAGTASSPRRVYMIDASKLVASLGARMPLPIEVLQPALAVVQSMLDLLGLPSAVRSKDGVTVLTDNGHLVLDARLNVADLQRHAKLDLTQLAAKLDATAGIVDHGLFLSEADVVLVEPTAGSADMSAIQTRVRPAAITR